VKRPVSSLPDVRLLWEKKSWGLADYVRPCQLVKENHADVNAQVTKDGYADCDEPLVQIPGGRNKTQPEDRNRRHRRVVNRYAVVLGWRAGSASVPSGWSGPAEIIIWCDLIGEPLCRRGSR